MDYVHFIMASGQVFEAFSSLEKAEERANELTPNQTGCSTIYIDKVPLKDETDDRLVFRLRTIDLGQEEEEISEDKLADIAEDVKEMALEKLEKEIQMARYRKTGSAKDCSRESR